MARKIEISKPGKTMYPKAKATKQDIADYYEKITGTILPFLKKRPLILECYPDGIEKDGFFQQNVPDYYPDWVTTQKVKREKRGKKEMVVCNNKQTLLYLVDKACFCFHTWNSQTPHLEKPDALVFDLDPPKGKFSLVVKGAKHIKQLAEELGLTPYVMTTGSKGLHILIPIKPKLSFDEVRAGAKKMGKILCDRHPSLFTLEVCKNKRKGRVFVDYLRNSYGMSTICPYSLRSIKSAPIAMPLRWNELTKNLDPQKYTIKNALQRLSRIDDPWKGFNKHKASFQKALKKLEKVSG